MDNFNFNSDFWRACQALAHMDEGAAKELAWDVLSYAYEGAEPADPAEIRPASATPEAVAACEAARAKAYATLAVFEGLRGRVDAAKAGAKKGRPARKGTEPAENPEVKGVAQNCAEIGKRVSPNPFAQEGEKDARTLPTEREGEGEGVSTPIATRAGARPGMAEEPDAGEVSAWFEANSGLGRERAASEAAQFLDHFSAQGWLTPNGARIVDWRAKARQWVARGRRYDLPGGARAAPAAATDPELAAYGRVDGVVANG